MLCAVRRGSIPTPPSGSKRPRGRQVIEDVKGADTALWLASAPEALEHSGELWLDRRIRSDVRVPGTHTSDVDRARLWAKVAQQAHSASPG